MICKCNTFTEMDGWPAKKYAKEHLRKVRVGNWEIEYECPETGIHWLLDYPQNAKMGGGPPRLIRLTNKESSS